MKRFISLLLIAMLLAAFAVPASAASMEVCFTDDSSFVVGGTVKVDIMKTMTSISADPSCTSDIYNAYLEGQVSYWWFRNGSSYKEGSSITLTENDKACQFQCYAYLFSDADCTQQCGVVKSAVFSVPNTDNPALKLEILTKELPSATVNAYYDFQIQCSDKNANFELFRSPDFDKTGLSLSKTGRLTGTPKTKGIFVFTVMATNEDGAEETVSYEFIVSEAAAEPEFKTTTLPKATVGKQYYTKIECSDPDATIQEYYNPGKANDLKKTGLVLTQHGELEGTPKTAGSFTFCLSAVGEGGEAYQVYTLVVEEAEISIELIEKPKKITYKVGEELDLTGLKVKINKADGTTVESLDGDMLEVSGSKLDKAGKQDITLTYEGKSITLTVKVRAEKEEETEEPTEPEDVEKPTKSKKERKTSEDTDEGPDLVLILIICGAAVVAIAATTVAIIVVSKKKKNS